MNLTGELVQKIDSMYKKERKDLGLTNKNLIPDEVLQDAIDLSIRWRQDTHALINHFTARILNESYSVTFSYHNSTNCDVTERKKKDLSEHFSDINIHVPAIQPLPKRKSTKKRKKRQGEEEEEEAEEEIKKGFIWMDRRQNLGLYLTSQNKTQLRMEQHDKVCYNSLENYPALPSNDPRDPERLKKENKLNTFKGLEITSEDVTEYKKTITITDNMDEKEKEEVTKNKEKHERDLKMLIDHHLHGVFNGNKEAHNAMLKFMAWMWRKPWEKPDFSPTLRGDPGVGKSIFYSQFIQKLFGRDHAMVIDRVEELKGNFNSNYLTKLVLIFEEVTGANRHDLSNLLKSLNDYNKNRTLKRKNLHDRQIEVFFKLIFLTNEIHVHQTSMGERVVTGSGIVLTMDGLIIL